MAALQEALKNDVPDFIIREVKNFMGGKTDRWLMPDVADRWNRSNRSESGRKWLYVPMRKLENVEHSKC